MCLPLSENNRSFSGKKKHGLHMYSSNTRRKPYDRKKVASDAETTTNSLNSIPAAKDVSMQQPTNAMNCEPSSSEIEEIVSC